MEKAEILEAAVEYMKEKRKTINQVGQIKGLGYNACANEILRYLATNSRVDDTTCTGLRHFLKDRCPMELPAQDLPRVSFHPPEVTNASEVFLTKPTASTSQVNELTMRNPYGFPVVPINRNGLIPYMPYNVMIPFPTMVDSVWKPV